MVPTIDRFRQLAREGNVVPVWTEIPADLETPASIYLKLRNSEPSFLLESVERGEQVGRYSFLGFDPAAIVTLDERGTVVRHGDAPEAVIAKDVGDPLAALESILTPYRPAGVEGLPEFFGGLVGYLGYDAIRHIERIPMPEDPGLSLPEGIFLLTGTLVVFDHVRQVVLVIVNASIRDDLDAVYGDAVRRIECVLSSLRRPVPETAGDTVPANPWESSVTQSGFEAAVRRTKQHIREGDIFQGVLSQRLSRDTAVEPFSIYRALRRLNPSPYMYYLELPRKLRIIGSSPETMVRLSGRQAEVRPIAGTRRRGASAEEDATLAADLLADPKERAEHVMLVDLGRNDLGRVCEHGTVSVPVLMTIEQYSHVMHIVSSVQGSLRPGLSGFDLLRATFPAGTVSGAPKIRAMEIISELEPDRRGPYAGAVGYFGFGGAMDTCIAIRTLIMKGDRVHVQAGAGIVADSDPAREYQETLSKAEALAEAVLQAEAGVHGGGRR